MRIFGIVIMIVGVLMLVYNSFNLRTEKTIATVGPLKINQQQDHSFSWPGYVGGIAAIAGIVLIIADRKKN